MNIYVITHLSLKTKRPMYLLDHKEEVKFILTFKKWITSLGIVQSIVTGIKHDIPYPYRHIN